MKNGVEQNLRQFKIELSAAGFLVVAAPIAMGLLSALVGGAQSRSAPSLKFEVASIKASQPGAQGGGIRPAPGGERYVASNLPLKMLIMVAYRIKKDQVVGGPSWIDTSPFDMNAKAERPSTIDELHIMLQNLLAEEFKLQFHRETRELPVHALKVDTGGARLQPHEAQSAGDPWIDSTFEQQTGEQPKTTWHAKFSSMSFFAWRLSQILDRPVIDQTGLKGDYDFDLSFTVEPSPGGPASAEGSNGAPTIFGAVRRLGLKLERQKGPVEIIVIDHAEKPDPT